MHLRAEMEALLEAPPRKQESKEKRDSIMLWQDDAHDARSWLRRSRDDSLDDPLTLEAMFEVQRGESPGWCGERDIRETGARWRHSGRHSVVSDDAHPPVLLPEQPPQRVRRSHSERERNPSPEGDTETWRSLLAHQVSRAILELAYALKSAGVARWRAHVSQRSRGMAPDLSLCTDVSCYQLYHRAILDIIIWTCRSCGKGGGQGFCGQSKSSAWCFREIWAV